MRTPFLLLLAAFPLQALPIATNKQAHLPILLSPKASQSTQSTAQELARYLEKITGAKFEIRQADAPDSPGILLGTLADFPDNSLNDALQIKNRFDGLEAYAIRTDATRLRLIGASDLGVSHAAFRLLESLGCRWFFPHSAWEVIPTVDRLEINLNETDRPVILSRRIWYGYGYFTDKQYPGRAKADYDAWARHNRMASSLPIRAGHAWQNIIADNKKLFEDHPEYLALVKDKRQGPQLCVSNPAVQKLAAGHALKYLEKHPAEMMASMECSDGSDHCECADCAKLGSVSDRVFGLANHVAAAVEERFPGKMVGVLAYNDHSQPPTSALRDNVYVQLTAGFTRGQYTFDELLDLWPKKCRNLGYYDYFSVWLWDFDRLPGGRAADLSYIRRQIPRYVFHNATSLDCESGNNWGPHGRGYYIANKLMWNPGADVDALLADFYDKAFGPGAAAMKRYYERLDPGNKPLPSRHLLALAFRDVEEAGKAAADRPDVQARLDQIKQYLRYVHLCWLRDRESDKAKKKPLALQVIKYSYRIRATYMTHWAAMLYSGTSKYAKELEEPTWDMRDKTQPKPWMDDSPITREQVEQDFAQGLAYFQPQSIEEKQFSTHLVPTSLKGKPAASSQIWQKGLRYALYSRAGEPLDIEIIPGTIAWYRDRADFTWSLASSDDKPIESGRLKLDGEKHNLSLKVPAPGLYWFTGDDHAAGWRITVHPDRPFVLIPPRERALMHLGQAQPLYFYVPRGTKTIQYFWEGRPHTIIGPDNKPIAQITTSGEFISIPVPDGTDGKPWRIEKLVPGHLVFFNIPNALAASPQALLLPKEVVESDNLQPN